MLPQAGCPISPRCITGSSNHDQEKSQLGVLYGFRAGAAVAANVPKVPPPSWRKDLCQRLAQVCHPACCFVPRNHAPLVRIAALADRLTNQDLLLSNGRKNLGGID